jgi:hypothetical protein
MWENYHLEQDPYKCFQMLKNIIFVQPYLSSYYETTKLVMEQSQPSTTQKPRYYNPYAKKRTPYASTFAKQQPKPKMSNSFEYLQGSIAEIQKKYEILSDIVSRYGGKVHGSQFHIIVANNTLQLIVYYEVP